jgi:hypothetical protein
MRFDVPGIGYGELLTRVRQPDLNHSAKLKTRQAGSAKIRRPFLRSTAEHYSPIAKARNRDISRLDPRGRLVAPPRLSPTAAS